MTLRPSELLTPYYICLPVLKTSNPYFRNGDNSAAKHMSFATGPRFIIAYARDEQCFGVSSHKIIFKKTNNKRAWQIASTKDYHG